MLKVELRQIDFDDIQYFSKWWRDTDLLRQTSGRMEIISDIEVENYFNTILNSLDYNFMIDVDNVTVGNLSLVKSANGWHEMQIVIGDKNYLGKGYGPNAILLLLEKAKQLKIGKIFVEVRPDNTRAIRAYKKCGFKEAGIIRYPGDICLPETLRMEIKLDLKLL